MATVHVPVLLAEVVESLQPLGGKVVFDGTFGGGGYTEALLKAGAKCVIATDRDPQAIKRGQHLKEKYGERLVLVKSCFSEITKVVQEVGYNECDGIVLDLGFSSDQLDDHKRGFAFQHDGPLDMRMASEGVSASDVVNTYSEEKLADIFWRYGEEKKSRLIAKKIAQKRIEKPFETTRQLVKVIEEAVPIWQTRGKPPAMKVFQALRIYVNNELGELEKVLPAARDMLCVGGKLLVVSFHSLEDRMVKRFLASHGKRKRVNKYSVQPADIDPYIVHKDVAPGENEISKNSRARSSRLRVLERMK